MIKGIKNQILVAFLVIAIVPLLTMGVLNHLSSSAALKDGIEIKFSTRVKIEKNNLDSFLKGVKDDIHFLKDSPTLHRMLAADSKKSVPERELLEKEFLALAVNKDIYCQIRYIDNSGKEVVRVDTDGEKTVVIPQNKLQDKSDRYYFKESVSLNRGKLYVSPLDLNRERGTIEKPLKPVIRYATPVFHEGQKRGIVIVNVLADKFLDPVKKQNSKTMYYLLISNNGYYFSHPDSLKEWGSRVDLDTKENLSKDFPEDIASKLTSRNTDIIEVHNEILAQSIYYPDDKNNDLYWKLIGVGNKNYLFAPLSRLLNIFLAVLAGSVLFTFIFALLVSKTITEPLIDLTKAGESISQGKLDTPVKVYGSNEIRKLAQTIQRMKESLEIAMKHLMK